MGLFIILTEADHLFYSVLHPEGLAESLRALPTTTTKLGHVADQHHSFLVDRLPYTAMFLRYGALGVPQLREKRTR
jgi:hypothetical protein